MASSIVAPSKRNFANYPLAQECPHTHYKREEDKNPPMRGYTLVAASTLLSYFPSLQNYFWTTSGFGSVKYLRYLNDAKATYVQPSVIPLPDPASTVGPQSLADLTAATAYPPQTAADARFHSAADYHAMYRQGTVTPLQVAEALLPFINGSRGKDHAVAWTACNEDDVLADARASTERWAAGRQIGTLDGVPFGVKCDTDTKGYVNTAGIKPQPNLSFFQRVQEDDCWAVKKLREAGAIMVGRLTMVQIGMDVSGCNAAIGSPLNWHNKSYYTGGSSSGAGSVVGVGLVPIAVGTDAGGSVRIPSSFNGCFGLKPTHDRTQVMTSVVCVTGPLGATATDLRLAYRVMAQPNPECPVQGRFAPTSTITPPGQPPRPRLLGICREWLDLADADVRKVLEDTIEHLTRHCGYQVVDVALPFLREGQLAHAATCLAEAVDRQRARHDPARGDAGSWLDMLTHPSRILLRVGQHTPASDMLKMTQLRQVLMRHLAALFARHPGLLLLSPSCAHAGWPVRPDDLPHGFSEANRSVRSMAYAWLANSTGCPSVVAPAGYVDPAQGSGRLPVAAMALAEWGEEEALLDWAAEVEAYLNSKAEDGGRKRPEGWVDVLALAKEIGTKKKGAEDEEENEEE